MGNQLTFGELFAGIGGFSLGLERAGMECKWQVEIDDYARRVLHKHWPNVRRHDDVRTFPPAEDDYSVDIICGGFPCQDISVAGKGAGLAGKRSGLWYEFARIIGELRPRYVIVENVAALLHRGMDTVLGDLSTLGYDAEWHVIPASAVGAPHRRDRVWIVAYSGCKHGDGRQGDKPGTRVRYGAGLSDGEKTNDHACRFCQEKHVAHAVSKPDAVRRDGSSLPPALACGRCNTRESVCDCGAGCPQEPGQGASNVADANLRRRQEQRESKSSQSQLAATQRCSWWETEPAVGRVVDGIPHRVDRLRCLGNAVVPQVVELIGRAIMEGEQRCSLL